jgi:hypothetical protein
MGGMRLTPPLCHRCRQPIAANQLARAVPNGEEMPVDVHAGCIVLARNRYRRL